MWLWILLIVAIIVGIILLCKKSEDDAIQEQIDYFNNEGRPLYDKEKRICMATGTSCPVRNPQFTCADCSMANAPRVVNAGEEKKIPTMCEYCGADLPKEVKDGSVTCQYCGRIYKL